MSDDCSCKLYEQMIKTTRDILREMSGRADSKAHIIDEALVAQQRMQKLIVQNKILRRKIIDMAERKYYTVSDLEFTLLDI